MLGSLGAGGMGEVYRARDTQLQRTVAVKVIAEEAVSPQLARRLENEALAASALNHPNILTVFSFSSQDGVQYLATELVDGETLRARLRRGSLSIQEALERPRRSPRLSMPRTTPESCIAISSLKT